jgi:hypothetical protein
MKTEFYCSYEDKQMDLTVSYMNSPLAKTTKLRDLSPWANYTERLPLSAKLVPTFADKRWHVVRVTDPYGRILRFLDQSRYFFFQ